MKHIYLLLLLLVTGVSQAQETVFKDNLFDDANYSVLVKKRTDYYVMYFGSEEGDSVQLYSWKYEPVLKLFLNNFRGLTLVTEEDPHPEISEADIVKEAGRVFYTTEAKMMVADEKKTGPIAGTFGFVNKTVVVRRSFEYKDWYLHELHKAKKLFKEGDSTVYANFQDGKGRKMIDTILDKTREHSPHYLKRNGPKAYTRAQVHNLYTAHIYLGQNREADLHDLENWFYYKKLLARENYYWPVPPQLELLNEQIKTDSLGLAVVLDRLKKYDIELASEKYKQFLGVKAGSREYELLKQNNPKLEAQYLALVNNRSVDSSSFRALTNDLDKFRNKRESLEILNDSKEAAIDSLAALEMRLRKYTTVYNIKDTMSMNQLFEKLSQQKRTSDRLRSKYGTVLAGITIDSVRIKVDKTFIESMVVFGKILPTDLDRQEGRFSNTSVMFYNNEPIGISTLTSIDHSFSSSTLLAIIDNDYYELDVRDVIAFYNPVLMNGRSDLSPADTTFTIVKNEGEQVVSLYKTATQKLFEMKVYSDFVGLNGTTPNGLVQLEFSKEMYLTSKKHTQVSRGGFYLNHSFGTYVSPFFTMSKLEKTNKFLPLTVNDSNRAVRTVELKRYEMFSAGADINAYSLIIPRWKTQFFLDPGIAFGRIGLVDTVFSSDTTFVVNQSAVNSFATRLTAKFVFQTDERYFFDVKASMQWYKLLNQDVLQIKEEIGEELSKPATFMSKVLFNVGLNAGFSPTSNTNGKLFIRYNYYGLTMKKTLQGFSQIQLGYSYYLNN
ncbi:MAG TPA: hypothetical protein VK151_16460 [Fluviicola sp.]|nr:hypothetical protein [Fluviicola sp.]